MDKNNKDFENTLNIHEKALSVYANLELRTQYYTNKLLTSDNYVKSLEKNSNSKYKTYISEIPLELDYKLSNNDLLGNILKDIVIRYSLMKGLVTDTKLLFSYTNTTPKENKEYKSMNEIIKKEINTINKAGSCIDFSKVYTTTNTSIFANKMLDVFYDLYNSDKIYSEDKPTKRCTKCKNTIETNNKVNVSNYFVLFRVAEDPDYILAEYNNLRNIFIVASTIRPWTLIGVNDIALESSLEYSVVETKTNYGTTIYYIIATKYVEDYMANALIFDYNIKKTIKGNMLKNVISLNPIDCDIRVNCIITNNNLSSIDTGAITIFPAHSYLEYTIYREVNSSPIRNLIDINGRIYNSSDEYRFKYYKEIEKDIITNLTKADFLLFVNNKKMNRYECANCGNELVYRYLSEWYINETDNTSVEKDIKGILKKVSIKVNIPDKKSKYLKISKNTARGVNIPVITCGLCNKKIVNSTVIEQYKEKIEKYGAERVYEMTPEELLEGKINCECGSTFFFKNENLFNETFEILASDIVQTDLNYEKTNNIFISNIDKFINSIEINRYYNKFNDEMKKIDKFFIYGNIHKNKKILGIPKFFLKEDIKRIEEDEDFIIANIDITDIINKYGPDVLRLWALHKSKKMKIYIEENDVKYEERIYFNIRKTLSFIISNITDFDFNKNYIEITNRTDLDKYVYVKINHLREKLIKCYQDFNFYKAYVLITDFCIETLCEEYFNAIKYNLYILNVNSNIRRSTQSTLYDIFDMLNIYLQPIIPYLFIESSSYLATSKTLLLEREKENVTIYSYKEEYLKWQKIFKIRKKLNKYIYKAQEARIITNTLEAYIIIKCKQELCDFINQNKIDILKSVNISEIETQISGKVDVLVIKSEAQKCERCHNYKNDVGKHVNYRYLCLDCANILENS